MSFLTQLIASVLVILLTGAPALAQFPAEFIPPPKGYTILTLPTSGITDGQMARVTDGGAAGALIYWDNAGSVWRCYGETLHILYLYCPPYNADADATDSTNRTAMQAVLDRTRVWDAGAEPTFWRIDMGEDVLQITGPLTHHTTPNSSTLLMIFTEGNGGLRFGGTGFTGTGDIGLQIGDGVTAGNVLYMRNLVITGGGVAGSTPESLVETASITQVWMENLRLGGITQNGIKFVSGGLGGGHLHAIDGQCSHGDPGPQLAGAACILMVGLAGGEVSGWRLEGTGEGSNLTHLKLSGNQSYDNLLYTNNTHRGNSWYAMVDGTASNITLRRSTFTNNTASGLEAGGILLASGNANTTGPIKIKGNDFSACRSSTCGLSVDPIIGITTNDQTNVEISGNTLEYFDIGIRGQGSPNTSLISDNIITNTRDVCVQIDQFFSNTTVGPLRCGGAATADVKFGNTNSSSGNNHVRDVVSVDGSLPIFDFAGLDHVTDTVEFANAVQVVTCADNTVGASIQTAADAPVYRQPRLDNNDPDGCDWTPSTSGVIEGTEMIVGLTESAGGTVNVIGAATDAITVNDSFLYRFVNGAWRKIN